MKHALDTNPRVRAWVLIQAQQPVETAARIYDALGHEGRDRFVVVRCDVVDYHHNVVVPVDAESMDALAGVYCEIKRLAGEAETVLLPVLHHNPMPPHLAHGFIDPSEARAAARIDPKLGLEVGRLGNSPGQNAWG